MSNLISVVDDVVKTSNISIYEKIQKKILSLLKNELNNRSTYSFKITPKLIAIHLVLKNLRIQ